MSQPKQECDLVMRGGIASGVVYPTAVAELAKTYRLRNIGGTSAGAIAAMAAAAAEYGRREATKKAPSNDEVAKSEAADNTSESLSSFEKFAKIPGELSALKGGNSKLFRLFQAQPGTAPLYRILRTFLKNPTTQSGSQMMLFASTLIRNFPGAALLGALPAFITAIVLVQVSPYFQSLITSPGFPVQPGDFGDPLSVIGVGESVFRGSALAIAFATLLAAFLLLLLFATSNIAMVAIYSLLTLCVAGAVILYLLPADADLRIIENLIFLVLTFMMIGAAVGCAMLGAGFKAFSRAKTALPANFYGLCSGRGRQSVAGAQIEGLSEWMHAKVQDISGKPADDPLTVGDLWGDNRTEPDIDLALITTNITRSMPHRFPFLEGETADGKNGTDASGWRGALYFRADELEKVLPPAVVDCLIQGRDAKVKSGEFKAASPKHSIIIERDGSHDSLIVVDAVAKELVAQQPGIYYRLPMPEDLPVMLGARMSMSFPILLSAVPLYTSMDDEVYPTKDGVAIKMPKCWFSDGGLTSNFPIHLFDSPVPGRPTFGISLVYGESDIRYMDDGILDAIGETEDRLAASEFQTYMPSEPMTPRDLNSMAQYKKFEHGGGHIGGFLSSLLWTSADWTDNELMNMPGNRDRIVHVLLGDDEGGYNLNMPKEKINSIAAKGAEAGKKLAYQFSHDWDKSRWDSHRWVRYRVFMSAVQDVLNKFGQRLHDEEQADGLPGTVSALHELVQASDPSKDPHVPSYRWSTIDQFGCAHAATEEFRKTHATLGKASLADGGPRPKPKLTMGSPAA